MKYLIVLKLENYIIKYVDFADNLIQQTRQKNQHGFQDSKCPICGKYNI
jgi:hypothetical protein